MTFSILSITPVNHLAFFEHAPIELSPGVTLILGKNNTGKTSLLHSLALDTPAAIHNGPLNARSPRLIANPNPEIRLILGISPQVVRDVCSQLNEYSILSKQINIQGNLPASIHEEATSRDLKLECILSGVGPQLQIAPSYSGLAIPGAIDRLNAERDCSFLIYRRNSSQLARHDLIGINRNQWPMNTGSELSTQVFHAMKQRLFRFHAERRPHLAMKISKQRELAPNAANLVAVLDLLHSERRRFSAYERYVQKILPEIGEIRIQATDIEGEKEIRIAMAESVDRGDLTFQLNQLGSGTTQILALVHAITMSETSRVILIDELSTFLHPGATRELLRLVAQFPQHQYVIATHATTALDVLPAARLLLVERGKHGEATVRSVETREVAVQRSLLQSLGASLQDVFGADHVVWVEGPTEVAVLRGILAVHDKFPRGVAILPIVNVGDLESSKDSTWGEVYRRLSSSGGLVPSHVSFVLDREDRSQKALEELGRRTSGHIFVMDGIRMTENMFLDPTSVKELLLSEMRDWDPAATQRITEVEVSDYWKSLQDEKRYKTDRRYDTDPQWRMEVHAAAVLADTCSHFSDARLAYDKIRHGAELAQIVLTRKPELLQPAVQVLERALGVAQVA